MSSTTLFQICNGVGARFIPAMALASCVAMCAACGSTASATRTPVEVTLSNGTDRKEVMQLVVYERGPRSDGSPKKLYDKAIIIAPQAEHPPQVVATVPLGDYTEVGAKPSAYPGQYQSRVYRQTNNLQCRVSLVPTRKEPEVTIVCH